MKENKNGNYQLPSMRSASIFRSSKLSSLWTPNKSSCPNTTTNTAQSTSVNSWRMRIWSVRNNSPRNHSCSFYYFVWLNVSCLICSIILYLMNTFIIKVRYNIPLMNNHFNDFLAMILLLSFSNILLSFYKNGKMIFRCIIYILIFALIVGLFWEYITPLYRINSTGDPYDLIAYLAGGYVYYIIIKVYPNKHYQNNSSI